MEACCGVPTTVKSVARTLNGTDKPMQRVGEGVEGWSGCGGVEKLSWMEGRWWEAMSVLVWSGSRKRERGVQRVGLGARCSRKPTRFPVRDSSQIAFPSFRDVGGKRRETCEETSGR